MDEAALITALRAGDLAGGAGLDVYEFEPEVPEALIAMENVVLLPPHLGTATLEVRTDMGGLLAVENLEAFARDGSLVTPV